MFGRLAKDRIKSAAQALEEGRLDDAFKLLEGRTGRPPAEADAIITKLAEALMTRGQELLMSRRFGEALADFDRAGHCGADGKRLEDWRSRAKAALQEADVAQREARNAEAEAQIGAILPQATEDFRRGRLAQAQEAMRQAKGIGRASSERTTLESALRLAEQASRSLHEARYSEARVLIGRIGQLGIAVDWLADCQSQLEELQAHRQALLSGPLGLMSGAVVPPGITMTPEEMHNRPAIKPNQAAAGSPPRAQAVEALLPPAPDANGLPRRMVLRIDGVGAFLVLRGDRVTIGRAGPGTSADLELFADLSERQAQIIRSGEDYFIGGTNGVELAGRKVEHALLQHDDRIRLGSRVKLRFLRPSAKSVTSLLELGEGVRTTCESRRVILWGGPLIMSPSRDAHIVLPGGSPGIVLLERAGQVLAKLMNGHEAPRMMDLATPFVLGELRMSLSALNRALSPGRVIG